MLVWKDIFTQDELLNDAFEQLPVNDAEGNVLSGCFEVEAGSTDEAMSMIGVFGYQSVKVDSKEDFKDTLTDLSKRIRLQLKNRGVPREEIKHFMGEAPQLVKFLLGQYEAGGLYCYTGRSRAAEGHLVFQRPTGFLFLKWGLFQEEVADEVDSPPPPPPKTAAANGGGASAWGKGVSLDATSKVAKKPATGGAAGGRKGGSASMSRATSSGSLAGQDLTQQKTYDGDLFMPSEAAAGAEAAATLLAAGPPAVGPFFEQMRADLASKEAEAAIRGVAVYQALVEAGGGAWLEPFLVHALDALFAAHANRAPRAGAAAEAAALALLARRFNPNGLGEALGAVYRGFSAYAWQAKEAALRLLARLAERFPARMGDCLPDIIEHIVVCVRDTKRSVKQTALQVFEEVVRAVMTNPDVLPSLGGLLRAYENPVKETTSALDLLVGTTFVARVDAPTLALLLPVLQRGMGEKSRWKRVAALIMGNMCKLVYNPKDAARFFPTIEPLLRKSIEECPDEEVRETCEKTEGVVKRLVAEAEDRARTNHALFYRRSDVLGALREALAARGLGDEAEARSPRAQGRASQEILSYAAGLAFQLVRDEVVDASEWSRCLAPYLAAVLDGDEEAAEAVAQELRNAANIVGDAGAGDDDEGEDICHTEFSLAYGGKILLHNTPFRLKRGRRYGLVGKNGVGKTTLMRNIACGAVDGLPPDLHSHYVVPDVSEADLERNVLEYMCTPAAERGYGEAHCRGILEAVGFTAKMLGGGVKELSGGWQMKLALARGMTMDADLYLLDEPTNHLDVQAVAWLTEWLQTMTGGTALIVSHSTSFLDDVCTDIMHYEQQKLVRYAGNLSKFVERRPEARSYYELASETLAFRFPPPGPLDGIRSQTQAIARLENVWFTYPGKAEPQLRDVSIKLVLASRVALIGPNGAGKSTLIKLLVGETLPDEGRGRVWKHHNLRVAYVAQHSFHHVEQHLEESPVAYMQWRFGHGEDREILSSEALKLTDQEVSNLSAQKWGDVKALVGRRRRARKLEYEVTFVDRPEKDNKYMTIEELEAMGFSNLIKQYDEKVKAREAGLDIRPTTTREIQKHLDDFGLEQEFGTYGKIRGLSGGQKVKLVLAAAMWNCPHLMVLDEPTNYLDREALGAFATAIKSYAGGVIMISHDREFYEELCTEKWHLVDGTCVVEGEAEEIEGVIQRKKKVAEQEISESGKKMVGNINQAIEHKVTTDFFGQTLSKKDERSLAKLQKKNDTAAIRKLLKIPRGQNFQGY
mmetsp:Transcript_27727/g.50043  ORF Transcript_27727/g.50043 Transcript_27727/m.50043 type:complete len:1266 (+) Transcript_27727:123-3920(+)